MKKFVSFTITDKQFEANEDPTEYIQDRRIEAFVEEVMPMFDSLKMHQLKEARKITFYTDLYVFTEQDMNEILIKLQVIIESKCYNQNRFNEILTLLKK